MCRLERRGDRNARRPRVEVGRQHPTIGEHQLARDAIAAAGRPFGRPIDLAEAARAGLVFWLKSP